MIYLAADNGKATVEIKRSEFIAEVRKVDDEKSAREVIERIKKEHSLARHNCYAYITFEDGQERVRYSDDGEPQGTAGMPMLNVLKSRGLSCVVAVVTRYFGGVKLGAGGLVRAYTEACAKAVDNAELLEIVPCACYEIDFSYENYKKFALYRLPKRSFVAPPEYGVTVKTKIIVDSEECSSFENSFNDFFQKKQPIGRLNDVLYEFKRE